MTNSAAEQKAIEIVDAFMDTSFEEEADAAAWLVERITAALDEAERAGQEAVRRGRTARDSNKPQGFYPARLREAKPKAMDEARLRGARTIAGPLFQTATIRALPHLADKPTRRNHL